MLNYLAQQFWRNSRGEVSQLEATSSNVNGSTRGAALVMSPAGLWVYHKPVSNTKATKVVAAPGTGSRIIVVGYKWILQCKATAVTTTDGITIKWIEDAAGTPATVDEMGVTCEASKQFGESVTKCEWAFTENKSVTLEFSAAGGSDTLEYVGFRYIIAPA